MRWFSRNTETAEQDENPVPQPGSDHHPYERLMRTNKAQMAFIFLLLTYSGILTPLSIIAYKEGGKTEVIALTFDDSVSQYVNLSRGYLDRSAEQQIIVNSLKQYLVWRETIDHTTAKSRDEKIKIFTDPSWFNGTYVKMIDPKNNPNSPRKTYHDAGMTRDIQDVVISQAPEQPNTYFARFTAIDRMGMQEIRRQQWLMTIVAARNTGPVPQDEAALNPLGLKVYNYIPKELPNEN
ncbi:type IV secretion system protein [Kiloniella laminariae]|uniref:Type IV secretion system protein n=1 Tax=Kiloniella laminariae TaxID=454162 RepID=A0ABT4LT51_9PROT|nr:type IV secretion system protein [Kiloniella laminariae]MCZ4283107.1 type IV secretion system protein [Kiloniella laminariae]